METLVLRLRHEVRVLQFGLAGTFVLIAALVLSSFQDTAPDVLRVKGLVIEDDEGRARILIGAPVPMTPDRVRTNLEKAERQRAHILGRRSLLCRATRT